MPQAVRNQGPYVGQTLVEEGWVGYGFRGTNDSRGGIEKDVVKEYSGGWVPF